MAKNHILTLTNKENIKLQEIKKDFRFSNIKNTLKKLINDYKLKEVKKQNGK